MDATLAPPPLPAHEICKVTQSLQFPKCLVQPCLRPWTWLVDRGLAGENRLQTHIVMSGFPRAGTTLCQLMVEASVEDVLVFGKERHALDVARYGSRRKQFMMTKRPRDLFVIDRIRDFYARRPTNVKFVMFLRDPRAILTSQHVDRPGEFYVSAERWRATYAFWQWALQSDDVTVVRYEELVSTPQVVEQRLAEFAGWKCVRPFEDFHQSVPSGFDAGALNGIRRLDAANTERWKQPKYRERIESLLRSEFPDLPARLIELGYETDDAWVHSYAAPPRTFVEVSAPRREAA